MTAGYTAVTRPLAFPPLERRGNIDGFNSVLLTNPSFTKVVIILNNTDQADLEKLGNQQH